MDNKQARQRYTKLCETVSDLIRQDDPLELVAMGFPKNEYDVEVTRILPRLKNAKGAEDVRSIIHEEFVHWFADSAGPPERYDALGEQIWDAWKDFRETAAPE